MTKCGKIHRVACHRRANAHSVQCLEFKYAGTHRMRHAPISSTAHETTALHDSKWSGRVSVISFSAIASATITEPNESRFSTFGLRRIPVALVADLSVIAASCTSGSGMESDTLTEVRDMPLGAPVGG